jgi:serine O-acetyltransferase
LPGVFQPRGEDDRRAFLRALRDRHPGFREAILADARITAQHRGERNEFRSTLDAAVQVLRLCWVSDAFAAQALYRLKTMLQVRGVPVLPRFAHKLAMTLAQVSIGDPVIVQPGVYIVHGQIVIDGLVEISPGAVLSPWITIGLRFGNIEGPTLERDVTVGTGAKVIGPVRIGAGASIGANAVVVSDVAPGTTVVGTPARAA